MKGQIHPEDSRHITTGIQANDFLTFDPTRTHLVRAVEVKGKHLIVRRFDKKSVEWRTKLEKLDRNAGIVLSPEEAEKGFPGCLAAWGRVAQSSLPRSGSKVSRQMSPNGALPTVTPPTFQSVSDFVEAYKTTDKTIADLTGKFVEAADVAKQKQDEIVPHLAFMQSLLSKKGSNHHFVIEARKIGNKVPWWTDTTSLIKTGCGNPCARWSAASMGIGRTRVCGQPETEKAPISRNT